MRNLFLLSIILASIAFGAACGSTPPAAQNETTDTPTEAYKRLYAAVKAKNTDAIKEEMSKRTQGFAAANAQRQKVPVEKVYENGFTATTFAPSLPEIRDERVESGMGAIEVWNSRDNTWEDLPYVLENGRWKLAVGDVFANTFKSPGKGLSIREAEAVNAMRGTDQPKSINTNGRPASNANMNTVQVEPQPK